MPPSAITGMPSRRARWAREPDRRQLRHARAATRHGWCRSSRRPTPTLTASAPASASASTPSSVTTLPAMTGRSGHDALMRSIALTTPAEWPWAVSIDDRVDTHARRAPRPVPRDRRRRPTAAAQRRRPRRVARGVREVLALLDVLDGDQAGEVTVVVDERQLLDAVLLQDRLGLRRAWCRPRR